MLFDASRKQETVCKIDETALTKGQIRKLSALRIFLEPAIADEAFAKWLDRTIEAPEADRRAEGRLRYAVDSGPGRQAFDPTGAVTSCGEAAGASSSNRAKPDRRRQTGRLHVRDAARIGTKVETGQRQTESGSMLNPRACDTMTGAFAGSSRRHREYNQKADLGYLSAPGLRRRDRTGRNMPQLWRNPRAVELPERFFGERFGPI